MATQPFGDAKLTTPTALSDATTSPGSHSSGSLTARREHGLERRIAWLEEDLSLVTRRLRDEQGEGDAGEGGQGGLRATVARLDSELTAERLTREYMEARVKALETTIQEEREERVVQMQAFSTELVETLRALVARIDADGNLRPVSRAASESRPAQDVGSASPPGVTEDRLRALITRMDQSLCSSAAALKAEASVSVDTPGSSPEKGKRGVPTPLQSARGRSPTILRSAGGRQLSLVRQGLTVAPRALSPAMASRQMSPSVPVPRGTVVPVMGVMPVVHRQTTGGPSGSAVVVQVPVKQPALPASMVRAL